MGIRYIGSKARFADTILELAPFSTGGRFIDAFSGTGAVAAAAADRGWAVTINDSLPSAVSMSVGAVIGRGNVDFDRLGGYTSAVKALNEVEPIKGFIHDTYSPASGILGGTERRYFTEKNAATIDAMRLQVEKWRHADMVGELEHHLLLSDLMQAVNSVANISGTYGSFLKKWTPTSLKNISISPRPLPWRETDILVRNQDVFEVQSTSKDIMYYDPPYTKRQYSAYYHLLETVHAGDSPEVGGVTGLRPWKHKASEFCYKTRALQSLIRLVQGCEAERILLSYSTEGHVEMAELTEGLSAVGTVTFHPMMEVGRYRPNAGASANGATVNEYVLEIVTQPMRIANSQVRHGGVLV